jgi:hypothetical protein
MLTGIIGTADKVYGGVVDAGHWSTKVFYKKQRDKK